MVIRPLLKRPNAVLPNSTLPWILHWCLDLSTAYGAVRCEKERTIDFETAIADEGHGRNISEDLLAIGKSRLRSRASTETQLTGFRDLQRRFHDRLPAGCSGKAEDFDNRGSITSKTGRRGFWSFA